MRLRTRIVITYCLFFIPAFYYMTTGFQDSLKFRYLEGVEEALVDEARILAGIVSIEMSGHSFSTDKFRKLFETVYNDRFSAKIYQLLKTHVDMRVYITDNKGILIFDSLKRDPPGTDYSKWRDVFLTLRGEYGARSSKDDPQRLSMSTLYVAAPIMVNGSVQGVLSIGKPTANINDFISFAKSQILKRSLMAALLALVLSIPVMFFITRPLERLSRYVASLTKGESTSRPDFDKSDIGEVGRAVEKIHADLEARQYIEAYVQSLTHEIKSPVAAIAGASELLEEDNVPDAQRKRFLANIRSESKRIQALVDRMLALSSLEHRDGLEKTESIDMKVLVTDVIQSSSHGIHSRSIRVEENLESGCNVKGDPLLLNQAVMNLFQNALEFSSEGGEIAVSLKKEEDLVSVEIIDRGPGIPDYAGGKIFDRFYSVRRPDTGKKSTGLGLNFVKEIAQLHGGSVTVNNNSPEERNGTVAVLMLQAN
ncbi:MAG: two-component system sensor histidine kinase CreC [Desulfobacterales bacterium]|nr:two-component system sensor histidine kinase CreC [Desulfobacterales bacterium]